MTGRMFVIYPRGARTGGPEALHQLVDALRRFGHDATLVPLEGTERNDRVAQYERYDAPEVARIDDTPGNTVITAETAVDALRSVKRATRVCWWLSIDNSIPFRFDRQRADRAVGLPLDTNPDTPRGLKDRAVSRRPRRALLLGSRHIAQSEYARSYIFARLNLVTDLVTDYIPAASGTTVSGTTPAETTPAERRERIVAFNPKKGRALTDQVRAASPSDIEWLPLEHMTGDEVSQALGRASVYLDLGSHPGRDRLPREAARHGAVTVVAQRGAGAFVGDVPISDDYRVDPRVTGFEHHTVATLERILADRQRHVRAQDGYRQWIADDRARFFDEVARAFPLRGD